MAEKELEELEARLLERFAEQMHIQWAHWVKYLLAEVESELDKFGQVTARDKVRNLFCVDRWRRQIGTVYGCLTEKEKESDREWARKALALLPRYTNVANMTSPSGKQLFCCTACGWVSPYPDKRCQNRHCVRNTEEGAQDGDSSG